jgi:hypothetical protein
MSKQLLVKGSEHKSAHDAIVETNFTADVAICIGGKYLAVTKAEYDRIQRLGVQPTVFRHHEATGRIVSVPGRHG